MRVLVVEDNGELASLISDALHERGFACDHVSTLAEADAALVVAHYDVMILDLGLPDGDGRAWLRRRQASLANSVETVPTLILTSRGGLADRIGGLDAGADDYVIKPVDMDELASRIRALLRRPGTRGPVCLTSGPLEFDTVSRVALCSDRPLELSRREAALLELLMRREGSVVQRHGIEEALYSFDEAVTPNAIEAAVSRLRRKLEEVGEGRRLHTIRGVGYMLAPPTP